MSSSFRAETGRILVVEDEPLLRRTGVDLLEDEGFTVVEAGSGDEGLALLRTIPDIRVLFTDVHMPGSLDGLELARIAAAEYRHVRLVIVSGKATPTPGALPEGARFLAKPYEVSTVIAHMHRAMAD